MCGITFKRCTRVFDDEGRFAPEYDENDLRRVDADRVVMSIGQSIVWGDLLAGSKVELGRSQGALADPQTYQTAEPDIFVGGDVYTGPSFAIDAIAAGHEAAVSIHRFVQPGSTLTIGRNQRRYTALDRDDVVIESYDNASREVARVDREREKLRPLASTSRPLPRSRCAPRPPAAWLRCLDRRSQQVHRLRPVHHQVRVRCHPPGSRSPRVLHDGQIRAKAPKPRQVRAQACHQD